MKHLITLQAPEGATSLTYNGEEFEVTEEGTVKVPEAAVEHLIGGHGYNLIPGVEAELVEELVVTPPAEPATPATPAEDNDALIARQKLSEEIAALPGEYTDPEYVVNGLRTFFGDLFTAEDEATVRELVKAPASAEETGEKSTPVTENTPATEGEVAATGTNTPAQPWLAPAATPAPVESGKKGSK